MATQDNSVLGTEEEAAFLDTVAQGATDSFNYLGEKAEIGYDVLSEGV